MGWAAGLRMRAPVLHKVAGAPKAVTLVLPHEHWGTKGIKHLGLLLGELRASLPLLPHQQQDSQGSQGSYTATTHLQTAPDSESTGRTTPLHPRQ